MPITKEKEKKIKFEGWPQLIDLSQICHRKTHSKRFDAPKPTVGSTGAKFVLEKGEKLDQSTRNLVCRKWMG